MSERSTSSNPVELPPSVEIRLLSYPDLPQVIAIERRVFPTPWSLAMFVLELSKQSGICLAATATTTHASDGVDEGAQDGASVGGLRQALVGEPSQEPLDGQSRALVGYLICSRYDTIWHVMNVAVDIDRQRMGLASAMLAELYARVDDPHARFTLEVRRSNAVAIHLYEREGFRAAGLRRRYYQDNGEDALVMWRTPATREGSLDDVPNPGPI